MSSPMASIYMEAGIMEGIKNGFLNIIVASAMATLAMELWTKRMGSTGMMIMDAWIQGVYGCNRRYPCSTTIPEAFKSGIKVQSMACLLDYEYQMTMWQ